MMMYKLGVLAALAAGAVMGNQVTYNFSPVVAQTTTNFTANIGVNQFDPAMGTLTGIQFTLTGTVLGTVKFESFDSLASTVTSNLAATITLLRPDNTTIAVVLPTVSATTNLTAYDGILDFGGTSGRTFANVTNTLSVTPAVMSSAADLALFQGLGSITLPVTASASSSAAGAGNLDTSFNTTAGANGSVTYFYNTTSTPEPSTTILMLSSGLVLFPIIRRKLRKI